MVQILSKLLNIRASEYPRLLILYTMLLLVVLGCNWGGPVIEGAFLQQLGVAFLPQILMISALGSITVIGIYTVFADSVANDQLLIAILAISGLGMSLGLVLEKLGARAIAYPLLYLLFLVFLDAFNLHWATYISGFYDTRAAKRVFPVLASATRIGGIIAGLTLPLLNRALSPSTIILTWLASTLAMGALVWLMPILLKESRAETTAVTVSSAQHLSYLDHLREGYRFVSHSSFLRWMAVSTLFVMVLVSLLTYQTSQIFVQDLHTTENISNFIGLLNAGTNLLILPFQLFLFSRLIGRIGLGNANLIFPTITLASCFGLIVAPGLPTAALVYVDKYTLRSTLRTPIDGLLFNAVPLRMKGRARAFIGGLITPIGSLVGASLLLLPLRAVPWLLPALVGALGVLFLASTLTVRRLYAQALITMLEQEDFSFLLPQENLELTAADPDTLNRLQQKFSESTSPEFTIFMAKLISQIGGSQAVPMLAPAARSAADAHVRAAILESLIAADVQGEEMRKLCIEFLADPDGRVREAAVAGLEQVDGPTDPQFQALALEKVHDPDVQVRVRVLSVLAKSSPQGVRSAYDFWKVTAAVESLNELLADPAPERRARGVCALSRIADGQALQRLVEFLADPADEVRLEAALRIEDRSGGPLPDEIRGPLMARLIALRQDPIERVRQAALTVLGHIGTPECYAVIVEALSDSSPDVRTVAADTLVRLATPIIPILRERLSAPDLQLSKMAAVILSRIDRKSFGGLMRAQISSNLRITYGNYASLEALSPYQGCRSVEVLQGTLHEQNERLLDEIFYFLSALHDANAVNIVRESLCSADARVRANATEALESLTSPETAGLIASLVDPEVASSQRLLLGQKTWHMHPRSILEVFSQLAGETRDPWLRALMAYAAGEIGATLQKSVPSAERRVPIKDSIFNSVPSTEHPSASTPLSLPQIESVLVARLADPVDDVRMAARAAIRLVPNLHLAETRPEEKKMLSSIEKIIFLKEVPFFQGMTIEQLRVLANVCEEQFFALDARIFNEGDPGGALFVVVNGKVAIEREGTRKGSYLRLSTLSSHAYFGEIDLFDNSPRSVMATALQDTLVLRLRREPLIALSRQHPDLSLELINVLSKRLREANDRVAELTRSRPRELHKLFDKFD